jgi:hypothetical protein
MRSENDLQEAPFLGELAVYVYTFNRKQKATILAISFFIAHISTMAHEVLGHLVIGCLASGFTPLTLTSSFVECSGETKPFGWVHAAGTAMDLFLGAVFLVIFTIYRRCVPKTSWGTTYFVLWLSAYTFLLHGSGHLLTGAFYRWSDWDSALTHVHHDLYYRIGVTAFGAIFQIVVFYFWALRTIQPLLGRESRYKFHRALWLCTIPFVVNSVLVSAIALLPGPKYAEFAALISFGGTFLYGFLGILIHFCRERKIEGIWIPDPPITVNRSVTWIILGVMAVVSQAFFAVGIPWMSGPKAGWGHSLF